jgi:peroxiredoxin
MVLWVSLSVAVVVAVLVAVLASAGPASQVQAFSPLLGKPAPAITGKALDGSGMHSLSQYGGKWVLVNFAASWCPPCVQETPQLQTFLHDHAASGDAVILGVVDDEGDKANLASFLRSRHATWPVVDDPSSTVAYGVGKLPESYVIDPRGTVVANIAGEVNAEQLNALIAKYSAPAGS